jgi:copper chaperone NosL
MRRLVPLILLLVLSLAGIAAGGQKGPAPPGARDKCPVCGMFVAKYPDWTGMIVFLDATRVYFDGPKDLFTYFLAPAKYSRSGQRSDMTEIFVKDYYSLAFINGKRAFYVIGSNQLGPMGHELIPFARKADAEGFLKDHQGKAILRFDEVSPATLKSLR